MKNYFNRFFGRGSNRNSGKIEQDFDSYYDVLFDFTYVLIADVDESRRIVKNVLAQAISMEADLDSDELIYRFLFNKVDAAITNFIAEKPQMQRVRELLYDRNETKNFDTNQLITLEVLRAFREEMEKLPRRRRQICSLFFCGLSTDAVAATVGQSKQAVLKQKNKAIKDIRNALIRRGLIFIDSQ